MTFGISASKTSSANGSARHVNMCPSKSMVLVTGRLSLFQSVSFFGGIGL